MAQARRSERGTGRSAGAVRAGVALCVLALLAGPVPRAAAQNTAPAAETVSPDAFELSFWDTIKNSRNPEDFKAYLDTFPNGRFAALARIRLRQGGVELPAPPAPPPEPRPAAPGDPVEPASGGYEATGAAPVLAGPAAGAARIGTLKRGEAVRVTGRVPAAGLLRIEREDGKPGFVSADRLRPADAAPPAQPEPAARPGPAARAAEAVRDCADCPEMVTIPAGGFDMGSNELFEFEKPVHRVTIARPFLIGRHEVTLRQWSLCVSEGGCPAPAAAAADPTLPVTDVTWAEARGYADWLARRTGKRYRLPSEAEWEYAARGGGAAIYPWGARLEREHANCLGCNATPLRRAIGVGRFPPNDFGLHDMAGNAAEWVEDCWFDGYRGAPADGSARGAATCRERVLRGGSFVNDPRYLRSAARFKYDPGVRYYANGFRVARDP